MLPNSITRREREVLQCLDDGLDDTGMCPSFIHKPANGQAAYP